MSVKRNKPYGYTPHEVAVAYMRKGWNGAGSREGWYAKLRADAQKICLPTADESAIVQAQQKTPHK